MEQKVRRFIRFLRERSIKYSHRYNFDRHKFASCRNLSYERFIKNTEHCMIFDAFPWSATNEGDRFWDSMDKDWGSYWVSYI